MIELVDPNDLTDRDRFWWGVVILGPWVLCAVTYGAFLVYGLFRFWKLLTEPEHETERAPHRPTWK